MPRVGRTITRSVSRGADGLRAHRPSSTPRREDGRDRALARARRSNFPLVPSPVPVDNARRRREFLGTSRAVCVPDCPASHDGVSDEKDKVVDSKSGAARQLRDEYYTRRGVDLDTGPVSVQKLGGCSKACADSTSCRYPGRSSYLRLTVIGMPAADTCIPPEFLCGN